MPGKGATLCEFRLTYFRRPENTAIVTRYKMKTEDEICYGNLFNDLSRVHSLSSLLLRYFFKNRINVLIYALIIVVFQLRRWNFSFVDFDYLCFYKEICYNRDYEIIF